MTRQQNQHMLLCSAMKAIKYFLLGLASCTLTYVISMALNLNWLANLMVAILKHGLLRASVLLICLIAIAVITESIKS